MLQSTNEVLLRYNMAGIQEERINTEVTTKNSETVMLQLLKMVRELREVKHNCIQTAYVAAGRLSKVTEIFRRQSKNKLL